jgi:hypothetical protein
MKFPIKTAVAVSALGLAAACGGGPSTHTLTVGVDDAAYGDLVNAGLQGPDCLHTGDAGFVVTNQSGTTLADGTLRDLGSNGDGMGGQLWGAKVKVPTNFTFIRVTVDGCNGTITFSKSEVTSHGWTALLTLGG